MFRQKVKKPIRKLQGTCSFAIYKIKETLLWDYYYNTLREPKIKSRIPHNPVIQNEITKELRENGFNVTNFEIDVTDYREYIKVAKYHEYPNYYGGGKASNFHEKSLEHYLAAKLLNLSKNDVYIDVASANSPSAEIYHKIYGCASYGQDLTFQKGIIGNLIGGMHVKCQWKMVSQPRWRCTVLLNTLNKIRTFDLSKKPEEFSKEKENFAYCLYIFSTNMQYKLILLYCQKEVFLSKVTLYCIVRRVLDLDTVVFTMFPTSLTELGII